MSVVVRMEMPENCAVCPFVTEYSRCVFLGMYAIDEERRADNCPIICSLPEGHGELIERQPIIQFIEDGLNRGEYGHDQIEVMTEVFVAPTIVPATNTPTDTPTDTPTVAAERSET